MRDLALRFARAFEGFGLSTSMTSPRYVKQEKREGRREGRGQATCQASHPRLHTLRPIHTQ